MMMMVMKMMAMIVMIIHDDDDNDDVLLDSTNGLSFDTHLSSIFARFDLYISTSIFLIYLKIPFCLCLFASTLLSYLSFYIFYSFYPLLSYILVLLSCFLKQSQFWNFLSSSIFFLVFVY